MSKPEDVTQDAWDEALRHKNSVDYRNMSACEFVARAIMSAEKRGEEREREACADLAELVGIPMAANGAEVLMIPVRIAERIRKRVEA